MRAESSVVRTGFCDLRAGKSGWVTAVVTAANVADAAVLPDLLHGEETRVWGDGAYQGQSEVIRECAPRARDFTQRRCRYKNQIVD